MKKTSFNDFEFLRTLGKGAFSTVYLVKRKLNQKQYALKSIVMEKLKENEQQNSVNEIRILASISHPNIIGYKESFWNEKNKTLNIVMEYCDDGDLETKIKVMKRNRQKFDEPLIWYYAIQIIKGLKSLHDKKILHRDLKSANIFLTKERNECKIGDLNVSKVMKEKYIVNTQIGTPTYSSPEVWQNKPYSYKSDLWSVGCIIYEMCCLRPPFKGKNVDELCDNVCNGKIEKISSRYSDELWNLIKMLLEVDVKKRVDCDTILNSKLIKDKINELSSIYMENNPYINEDESSILDTIEYKNLRDLEKKIPKKNNYGNSSKHLINLNKNKIDNIDETIKNDSSFDELSISEHKPITNITKSNMFINDNNNIFLRNNNHPKTNFIQKIIKEGIFNKSLKIYNKRKSCKFLNMHINIFNDKGPQLKISKSHNNINNKLLEKIFRNKIRKKIGFTKYLTKDDVRKTKDKKRKSEFNKNNNLNIIMFPKDKVVKSGLMSLKEDIARKKSQQDLPISSYEKKPSDMPIHQTSNSNPKFIKKCSSKKNSSTQAKLNDSFNKKIIRHSLFDLNEQGKKEKSKFLIQNEKKNMDIADYEHKAKNIEPTKITGNYKKINRNRRNMMIKKYKVEINDIYINKEKNNFTNVEINNNDNSHTNKIRNMIKSNKEKINIQNITQNNNKNTTFYCDEKYIKKPIQLSDKNANKHIQNSSDSLVNVSSKFKNIKSNKNIINNLKKNSKIIEIDISNNNNNNINLKKSQNQNRRNPFNNSEKKLYNGNVLTNSQEIKNSRVFHKKLTNKQVLSLKNNNKYLNNNSSKDVKPADN